jgi:hypothetical protein
MNASRGKKMMHKLAGPKTDYKAGQPANKLI